MKVSASAWKHLRIPFSLFLSPIYFFALAWCYAVIPEYVVGWQAILVFIVLHLFLYPASNGYNSYFDKDESSIGGLRNPPPVDKSLYRISLLFDAIAVLLSLFDIFFAFLVILYGIVSKAYSHPWTRWKRYPVASWVIVSIFQGGFTFFMVMIGISAYDWFTLDQFWLPCLASTLLLAGSYPMTQIYQHDEDRRRGDHTISLRMGVQGTFGLSILVLLLTVATFFQLFAQMGRPSLFILLQLVLAPVLFFFGWWFLKVRSDQKQASYQNTMRLNIISSTLLITYMILWIAIEKGLF